jgi:hypothetical protein
MSESAVIAWLFLPIVLMLVLVGLQWLADDRDDRRDDERQPDDHARVLPIAGVP